MNNLGYSKDNVFIGDVRVKGQDETVIIGNENTGGDGYSLPEEKGTPGQVITMDPTGNTTSFQDAGASGNGRVIQNLFQMGEPYLSQYLTTPGTLLYVPLSLKVS